MAPHKLNKAQLAVLRWIAEGSPEDVMEGHIHRTSAAALRSRGLVKTSGRGRTWSSQITPEGCSYLDAIATGAGGINSDVKTSQEAVKPPARSKPVKRPKIQAPKFAPPKDLRGAHPLVIATREAVSGSDTMRDGRIWLGPRAGVAHLVLSRPLLRRALLVLHGLTREVIKRGWDLVSYGKTSYGAKPGIAIEIRGDRYPVEIHELLESLPFTEADIAAWRTEETWLLENRDDRMPPRHLKPKRATGRLRLLLPTGYGGGRASWTEGPRGPIESKLPSVLRTLAARAEARERSAIEAARHREERRREQEAEEARARRIDIENARVGRLIAEAKAWHRSEDIRSYLGTLEQKLPDLDGEEHAPCRRVVCLGQGLGGLVRPDPEHLTDRGSQRGVRPGPLKR
jgi:hypothetical protein